MANDFIKYEKDKTIDGVKSRDFVEQLDYSIKTEQGRIDLVKKILLEDNGLPCEYLVKIMTGESGGKPYINVNPNSEDVLSENISLFRNIEILTSYIINAPTADRLTYQQEYKFYRDRKKFEDAVGREHLNYKGENDSGSETDGVSESEIIDFYINKNINFKKTMDTKVTTKDKKNIPEIKEIEECILNFIKTRDSLKKQIEVLKKSIDKNSESSERTKLRELNSRKYKIDVAIGDMRKQQLEYKEMIVKPLRFKNPLPDSHERPNWELFDFFNEKHVEALLYTNINSAFNDYRQDLIDNLKKYIKNARLNETELYIFQEIQKGCPSNVIANNLNVSPATISRKIKRIAKEIVYQHELYYSDWYYTYIVKGTYEECFVCNRNVLKHRVEHGICHECKATEKKICSSCGEIKKIYDFGKKKDNKDGHKDICKECEKKNREIKNAKSLDEMLADLNKEY